ncbi:MAG TPA: ABC transporter permease [Candidatus Acidoferrales bacterium]|nr:ABC transporter permease [Candidatus Acidoferrales bacterium]
MRGHSVRTLLRSPGFTIAAVLTLTLGITATTSLFSIVNGVLLRPLPYKDSSRLVVASKDVLAGDFRDIQAQNHVFGQMALFEPGRYLLSKSGEAHVLLSAAVRPEFFSMLGAAPILGRSFDPSEYHPGADPVVLLSHTLWTRDFQSDPHIVGRAILLKSKPYTVIGVLPARFRFKVTWFDNETEIWLPLALDPAQLEKRGLPSSTSKGPESDFYSAIFIARLKSGVSLEKAQRNLDSIIARLASEHSEDEVLRGLQLYSLKYLRTGLIGRVLWPLLGGAALLLLVACINVSGLMLARGFARQREMAIRMALGAGRRQIVRLFFEESLLISAASALFGVPLSIWALDIVRALAPSGYIPRIDQVRVDGWVLAFVLLVALFCAVTSAAIPAARFFRSARNSKITGPDNSLPTASSRFAPLKTLLVAQIAAAMVLLAGASLMGRSLWSLITENLGFDPQNVTQVIPGFVAVRAWDVARFTLAAQSLLEKVEEIPTVRSASMSEIAVGTTGTERPFSIGQAPLRSRDMPTASWQIISPDFFRTLRISLVRGRAFTDADVSTTEPVAIINETLANLYFQGRNPIGQHLAYSWMNKIVNARIVGEVGDAKLAGPRSPLMPAVYTCLWQNIGFGTLYVRSEAPLASLVPALREKFRQADTRVAIFDVKPVTSVLSESSIARPKFLTFLLAAFAGLALTLTIVGIFGAVSFDMKRRTREICIRVALGAQEKDILKTVLSSSVLVALAGVGVGALAAFALTHVIRSWLYGVAPDDLLTFVLSGTLLLAICLVASYVPARRALRVDPADILRAE